MWHIFLVWSKMIFQYQISYLVRLFTFNLRKAYVNPAKPVFWRTTPKNSEAVPKSGSTSPKYLSRCQNLVAHFLLHGGSFQSPCHSLNHVNLHRKLNFTIQFCEKHVVVVLHVDRGKRTANLISFTGWCLCQSVLLNHRGVGNLSSEQGTREDWLFSSQVDPHSLLSKQA